MKLTRRDERTICICISFFVVFERNFEIFTSLESSWNSDSNDINIVKFRWETTKNEMQLQIHLDSIQQVMTFPQNIRAFFHRLWRLSTTWGCPDRTTLTSRSDDILISFGSKVDLSWWHGILGSDFSFPADSTRIDCLKMIRIYNFDRGKHSLPMRYTNVHFMIVRCCFKTEI